MNKNTLDFAVPYPPPGDEAAANLTDAGGHDRRGSVDCKGPLHTV